MMDILHVLDIGKTPQKVFADLVYKLNQEKRVVGVWYRKESEWDGVIVSRKGTVFDRDIVEEAGEYKIKRMILLVPEVIV